MSRQSLLDTATELEAIRPPTRLPPWRGLDAIAWQTAIQEDHATLVARECLASQYDVGDVEGGQIVDVHGVGKRARKGDEAVGKRVRGSPESSDRRRGRPATLTQKGGEGCECP